MSAVTIENDLVHYEVLGRGRPVILLHGWLSSWRYWIPSMQQLSMKYRTYALDLWGYGDSSKEPERLTLDAHLELLDSFMDKLGIPKAAFVGHSLGAAVMIRYAKHNPSRVARMLVISPPVFESSGKEPPAAADGGTAPAAGGAMPTVMARPAGLDQRIAQSKESEQPVPGDKTVFHRPQELDHNLDSGTPLPMPQFDIKPGAPIPKLSDLEPPKLAATENKEDTQEIDTPPNPLRNLLIGKSPQELLTAHLEKDTPEYDRYLSEAAKTAATAFAASALSFDQVDLAHDIRRIATPTLMIHGENDNFLTPPSQELMTYLGYNNPNFRCEVVPSVGHFPMLSDPTNFHRLMMDFLETRNLADLVLQKERWVRKVR